MKLTIKKLLVFFIFSVFVNSSNCQINNSLFINIEHTNSISIELFGNTAPYSINYEKIFRINDAIFSGRIGISTLPFKTAYFYDFREIGLLSEFSCLIPFSRHILELGNGISYLFLFDNINKEIGVNNSDLLFFIPRIGYRFYDKNFNRYLKIGFTPIIILDVNEEGDEWNNNVFIPFGGIAYGFNF
ncbi:MAG: hypothetical protein GXO79_02065 [Chlorobi bacterium]|nr:hypothetical protein [Chlorobiota bacterium]